MKPRSQSLERLIADSPYELSRGSISRDIADIVCDSRKASPGALFVCASGYPADRHNFLHQAAKAGAVAAIVEKGRAIDAPPDLTLIAVSDVRETLAFVSARFWENPSHELSLYGVTGTNGKTTSVYLLSHILERSGRRAGVIGTLGASLDGEEIPSDRTTPEANDLQRSLREMADRGADAVSMEVSSHALALGRVMGCRFAGAIFTNLTQDHLDFHASLENYFQAKVRLFVDYAEEAGRNFVAAINADDESGRRIASLARSRVLTFGLNPDASVRAEELNLLADGAAFRLASPWGKVEVRLTLMGRFNVYNALGAATLALGAGVPLEVVAGALESAKGVPGRFERVDAGQPFAVIVDYAHTPDGLENVLNAARAIASGRVLCVFGCGGDRDPGKRPKMGRIAGELSDVAFVTSDNPRSENPESIIDQILEGIGPDAKARVTANADRKEAIRAALREAKPGDLVMIAGKGHETYQILPQGTIHFDDREVAREALHEIL